MDERLINIASIDLTATDALKNDSIKIVICSFDSGLEGNTLQAQIEKLKNYAYENFFTLPSSRIININFARKFETKIHILVYRLAANSNRRSYELFDEIVINNFTPIVNAKIPKVNAKCKVTYTIQVPRYIKMKDVAIGFNFTIREIYCNTNNDRSGSDQIRFELFSDDEPKYSIPGRHKHYDINDKQKIVFWDKIKLFQNNIKLKFWEIDKIGNDLLNETDFNLTEDLKAEKHFYRVEKKHFEKLRFGVHQLNFKKSNADYTITYEIDLATKKLEEVLGGITIPYSSKYSKPIFEPFFNKIKKSQTSLLNALKENVIQTSEVPYIEKQVESIDSKINPLKSEEKKRVAIFISDYYKEFLSNKDLQKHYIEELTHTQYPVMAYPVYPEPAYYYLKQLSEKFILPASGSMPDNSMALFVNNPGFVEAFLCGMNTEMGRELLWREYPTDTRGSYFRKFWDTEVKKDIRKEIADDTFFDILPIHKWENQTTTPKDDLEPQHKLGQNHMPGRNDLLIFAIKGELLKKYPETLIFLSKAGLENNKILINPDAEKILPDLSAWLGEDTYIVGFPAKLEHLAGDPAVNDPGYFLTFMNRPGETRFGTEKSDINKLVDHSGETAANLLVQPYIFGKHVSQFLKGWNNA